MLNNTDAVYFIIWAIMIGIAVATFYINIQRNALSNFILALINSKCFDTDSAKTATQLSLSKTAGFFIKSAVKNQYGLKKTIGIIEKQKQKNESLTEFFSNGKDYAYFIECDDIEGLLKKYTYKKTSTLYLVIFVISIFIIAILATVFADWFGKAIYKNDVTSKNQQQQEFEDFSSDTVQEESNKQSEGEKDKEDMSDDATQQKGNNEDNSSYTPTIPVLPSKNK